MKFVRWLGAFGKGTSLSEAADWEQSQTERQVAVEPLWHGRSLIGHAKIGLALDHKRSIFARGWLSDAWTITHQDGTIRRAQDAHNRAELRDFRNMDRFLAAWSKRRPDHHGEAAFSAPVYSAVVVKSTATAHGMRRAKRLAQQLGLPLRILRAGKQDRNTW